MEKKDILGRVDHTLLKQTATWGQIETLCRGEVEHATTSVCTPSCYVKYVKEYTGEDLTICTVIGFPNGNVTTAARVFGTEDVVRNDTDEIDMVINIGMVKEGPYEQVLEEIRQIRTACAREYLKVIIETCLLAENEKKEMCRMVTQSGVDYIKISTGFPTDGAAREDAALLRKHSGSRVKVKAAGGIASLQDAEDLIALGADRSGTSRLIPQRYGMCRNTECAEI